MNFEECKNFDNNIIKKLIEKIEIDKNKNVEICFKIQAHSLYFKREKWLH